MRVFLIRHGQTEWNNASRAQGHTDIALDETGLHQAKLLGRRFADTKLSVVLCSDLSRARVTAEAVSKASGAPLEVLPELRERGFGDWEGKVFAEIHAAFSVSAFSRLKVRPPGGESLEDVWERLKPIARRLLATEEPIAVVSHGGALSLLITQILGATIDVARAFRFANTGVSEIRRLADRAVYLATYNDVRHLETPQEMEEAETNEVGAAV